MRASSVSITQSWQFQVETPFCIGCRLSTTSLASFTSTAVICSTPKPVDRLVQLRAGADGGGNGELKMSFS